MSGKKKSGGEEGGGESVGLWYISFSDMITLLLSFFVMLTTFSSFSKEVGTKFEGIAEGINNSSLFTGNNPYNSVVPAPDRVVDWTNKGSEKPTDGGTENIHKPRSSFWEANANAYRDRQVFIIPGSRLFWGKGNTLTYAGKELLNMLGEFLKAVPCQVVIREGYPEADDGADVNLNRASAIVEYLTTKQSIASRRFSLSATNSAGARKLGRPVVEIMLLARTPVR
jgi:chemotaxis protein MotB